MGPTGFPETSVVNYQSTLRNIPEEGRYHLPSRCLMKGNEIVSREIWSRDWFFEPGVTECVVAGTDMHVI